MKLCLIGSSRFAAMYAEANKELTLKGHIVYTIATISSAGAPEGELPEEQKMVLDLVHLRKIEESDAVVLITDETGYYGFSTKREMIWTGMLDKQILIYIPTKPDALVYQFGPMFGDRRIMDLPVPADIAKAWKQALEAPMDRQRETIVVEGSQETQ